MKSPSHRLLVVDDAVDDRQALQRLLSLDGYLVAVAGGPAQALAHMQMAPVDLIISDVRMPKGREGIELLGTIKRRWPAVPVILYTSFGDAGDEELALQLGAEDYLSFASYPVLLHAARTALDGLTTADWCGHDGKAVGAKVVAASPAMKALVRFVRRVGATNSSVLITGETGTGKEIIARAIHAASARARRKFVAINCGAIPDGFGEAELFGYRRGSFTGALRDKPGLVEEADEGTLFLDEVAELPPAMQALLLRFLDGGESRRLGENNTRRANVRVIAATNRSLSDYLAEGRFRSDLYYRLFEMTCEVPPLRERPEDIVALVEQWCASQSDTAAPSVTADALADLQRYAWPGNVRELRSVLGRALLCSSAHTIDRPAVECALRGTVARAAGRDTTERHRIRSALEAHHWQLGRTAESLGVSRWTLRRRLRDLDLKR